MYELLREYEKIIDRLFKADEWLKGKNIKDWEQIRGKKAYNEYNKLLKEAEQIQRDLKAHRKATN